MPVTLVLVSCALSPTSLGLAKLAISSPWRSQPHLSMLSHPPRGTAAIAPMNGQQTEEMPHADGYKPRWRGRLHQAGAMIFPLVGFELYRTATASTGGVSQALMFFAGVQGILAVSGVMHTTDWRQRHPELVLPVGKIYHPQWIRLLDYSMIFVGIGLVCSSLGALIMGHAPVFRRVIAPIVWGSAIVGITMKACFINTARWVEAVAFLLQGWACILGYPVMRAVLSPQQWGVLFSGGMCFTLGVIAYVFQWPDFHWHRQHFRAHEAFHLGTIGGFGCFSLLMRSLLLTSSTPFLCCVR
ncbi:hypothetical protein AB1Y20_018730 [Prymnesium parvum]|uniref:Hemolysin III n=1 Tax=Prymnesium parvum TaxID=97485 RepID=A0AB34JSL4_PRYPA